MTSYLQYTTQTLVFIWVIGKNAGKWGKDTPRVSVLFHYSYNACFIQGILKTCFFIRTRPTSYRGLSRNTKGKNMYWTLHERSVCNPSWQFHDFIPIRQPNCPSGRQSKFPVGSDWIFFLLRIGEDSNVLCSLWTNRRQSLIFPFILLLSCVKTGSKCKMLVGFDIPIHYLSLYMVQW